MNRIPVASRPRFSLLFRPPDDRLYGLDLLRFCAASSVFVVHLVMFRNNAGFPRISSLVTEIGRYGYLGVQLFFVLSGFVIFSTALRTDGAGFLAGRFARIFPTFAFCALVSMLVGGSIEGHQTPSFALYFANLTFIPQAFGFEWIDAVFWTLRYEVQFYGLVFLLLATGQLRRLGWSLTWLWLGIAALNVFNVLPNPLRLIFVAEYAALFIMGIGLYWCVEAPSPTRILLVITATVTAVAGELSRLALREATMHLALNPWLIGAIIAALPLLLLVTLHLPLTRVSLWLGLVIVFAASTIVYFPDEKIRPRIRSALARLLRRTLLQPASTAN
jgi:peptidoglycan/LPS O-acetylase OafA/YrhL